MVGLRILRSLEEWDPRWPAPIVTIGNFDGVHLGHRKILRRVVTRAQRLRGTPVVITFDPHPSRVLRPEQAPRLIVTPVQKQALLAQAGIEVLIILPFTQELSLLSPEDFVRRVLCGSLSCRELYVGANFRFGHGQAGDVTKLEEFATRFGYRLGVVAPVQVKGEIVSSTRIRGLIQAGEVALAARLLGRSFVLTGVVNLGHGIGQKFTVPTLNLTAEQELLPARGVYITETLLTERGSPKPSVTNVGYRPTFGGDGLQIETHLLGKTRAMEVARIEVRFRARLRDERKFPSPEALKEQILKDIEKAQSFFRRDHRR